MIQELREKLKGLKGEDKVYRYISDRWNYALDVEESNGAKLLHSERQDELPYMPVEPELLGVNLDLHSHVLDIGCMGGYGLFDFSLRRKKSGRQVPRLSGLDIDPRSIDAGRDLAELWGRGLDVRFYEGTSEKIPFKQKEFDVVIARLLLPYVRMETTLSEISRVLKPSGMAVIQIHSFRYYWYRIFTHLLKPIRLISFLKPIISGIQFYFTRKQSDYAQFAETALTPSMLIRLCGRYGLTPVWRSEFKRKPMLIFRKTAEGEKGLRDET